MTRKPEAIHHVMPIARYSEESLAERSRISTEACKPDGCRVCEVRYVTNRQFLYIPFADLGIVVVGGGVGGAIPEPS